MVPIDDAVEMSPEQLKQVVSSHYRSILRFEKQSAESSRRPNMEKHRRMTNHLTRLSKILCEKMDSDEYEEWKERQLDEVTVE